MIVLQIDVDCAIVTPPESQAPIAADKNGISSFLIAEEAVKFKAWEVHILRLPGRIKSAQDAAKPLFILNPEALRFARLK
jgi:hypothetical protein